MLRLSEVRKSFGSITAVDGLSLSIGRGEVFGLLGPNGAGKSTTIGMSVGLVKPDGGRVEVEGLGSPSEPAVRRRIGVAPQAIALYDDLSALENMQFFGRLQGLRGRALRARAAELMEMVGLTDRARDRVRGYSGGMKRRLNLAVSLVNDPPLVMLDEPTAGVDPQSRNALFDLVLRMRSAGKTVVYTTHYMEEAQRLCDRVGIIDQGRLLALGTVGELLASHGGMSMVVVRRAEGESRVETADPVAELTRAMAAGGVLGVEVERPSLESVFLSLTGRSLRD